MARKAAGALSLRGQPLEEIIHLQDLPRTINFRMMPALGGGHYRWDSMPLGSDPLKTHVSILRYPTGALQASTQETNKFGRPKYSLARRSNTAKGREEFEVSLSVSPEEDEHPSAYAIHYVNNIHGEPFVLTMSSREKPAGEGWEKVRPGAYYLNGKEMQSDVPGEEYYYREINLDANHPFVGHFSNIMRHLLANCEFRFDEKTAEQDPRALTGRVTPDSLQRESAAQWRRTIQKLKKTYGVKGK